jgi:hypothetical protein
MQPIAHQPVAAHTEQSLQSNIWFEKQRLCGRENEINALAESGTEN